MQQRRIPHSHATMYGLRPIKGQSNLVVLHSKDSLFTLEAYYDSDWVACSDTRRSMSGYIIFFGKSLISWESKKQGTVPLSSTEAKYKILIRLVVGLVWLSRLLYELTVEDITYMPVKCDVKLLFILSGI